MLAVFILGREVFGVNLGFVVEVAHNLNGIGDIEHLDVILIGGDNNPNVAFGCFDEIILLQAQQIL
jgi:hypothetical protein